MAKDKNAGSEVGQEEALPENGEALEGGAPGKKKALWLMILAAALLLAGSAGGLLFFLKDDPGAPAGDGHATLEDAAIPGEENGGKTGVIQSVYYDMEEFVVNLNVGSKAPSFLKMTISLELANAAQIPAIEARMPRIRDSFQVYLRELRQQDLQGSAGMYRLREELLLRVNKIVYPAKINDILFKEILVQ